MSVFDTKSPTSMIVFNIYVSMCLVYLTHGGFDFWDRTGFVAAGNIFFGFIMMFMNELWDDNSYHVVGNINWCILMPLRVIVMFRIVVIVMLCMHLDFLASKAS
jgi:hypothetical protein